ncbi:MAG: hypothetical protein H7Z73_11330 [Candidatus Saccharibacteria bacterium]|nr:hypothetical protein [Moraxellaceae bacterium]
MDTPKEEFMQLQNSEAVVAKMAATIFASLINNFPLHNSNEDELVEKSVAIAIKIANRIEKVIKSDTEWRKDDGGSAYLA